MLKKKKNKKNYIIKIKYNKYVSNFLFFFSSFFLLFHLSFIFFFFFFFNDTATTEIYTLSLHDALPICSQSPRWRLLCLWTPATPNRDRKSTRLNSSHGSISYAVFCLKKKKKKVTN